MGTNREISELLLRASHDLRTPVRGIGAHAELLLKNLNRPTQPGDFAQSLGFIVDGARTIDRLVDALAGYATALQTDAGTSQSTRMDVLLRGVLAKLQSALRENGAEVTYDELPRVNANPDRMMQLFEQLIRNTLDHRGQDAPRVHISASEHADGGWLFSVRDNGPGIETEELDRVFHPFERLHGKGAGLGLAACRAVVEGHGWKIWAEPAPGGGCAIQFALPG